MRANCEKAMIDAVATLLGSIPIGYPNSPVKPPAGCLKWAQIYHLPIPTVQATVGVRGLDRIGGIVQVTMSYPKETGDAAATLDVTAFEAAFWGGRALTYGGDQAIVQSCGTSGGKLDTFCFKQHLSISWLSHVVRGG
jgi:hypothetical protein